MSLALTEVLKDRHSLSSKLLVKIRFLGDENIGKSIEADDWS